MTQGFHEWGMAIECPKGTPLDGTVTDVLLFNFEEHKKKNFPSWEGTPELKDGGLGYHQVLKRDDGEPVDIDNLSRWYEWDDEDQKRVNPEVPEGHHIELEFYQRYGWHAIVPDSFLVSTCACGGECGCGKSSESQGE